ncbi:hypothetical protein CHS0354_008391 [Potamilus streckersoni]|uniref:Ig-like domain-containing protein n=1 Tax=Potamilus streckersoni TaxID=2493646 RepID=A0AAE0RPE6_9BIVA|nr:hypothetical protein CHS0354_008391 [Potamilus streckersoni]
MVLRHSAMLVAIVSILCVFLSSGVPTVEAQGLSVSINEGDAINGVIGTNTSVTVTCSTTGATSVTWLAPNGFTINPAVSTSKYSINFNSITGISTLTIISIDSSDSGSYICRAADSFGQSLSDSISISAVNAILYDPSVQSDTLYAIEGDNFTLVCIASSMYAEAEVYWTLDGQRLTTSCTRSVFFGNQYTKTCLYIRTNVQRSDNSKVFFCLASVPGTDKQKKWTMSVTVRPTNPVITRTSATVQVGSTASWSCTTSGGNPTPILTWQLDLAQVSNGGSFNIPASTVTEQTVNGYTTYTVTSTISWTLVSQDIGKLLYCKVSSLPAPSNSVASLVINNSITVTVTVEILNGDSVSANEGQPITFTCRVVGAGSITVNWFGPKLISESKYTVIPYSSNSSQSTLTVSNLDSSDAGTYMCLARSSASSSDFSDSVTLAVTVPISVDITNGLTVTGTPGQSITLTCRVTGSGTITVFWIGLTGGQLLTNFKYTVGAYDTNSRQSNLTINSLTTSDAGTYTCRGSDSSGNTLVDTVQLIVTASLFVHITNGTTVTATQGRSVTLICEVTGSGSISVSWIGPTGGQLFTNFKYNVGAYNSNTRQSTLTINSGTTSDAGTYKCSASDSSGTQEDSTQLTFITLLTVTIDEGDSLSRPVGSDATITCSVSGSGTINIVWIGPFGNTLTSNGKYTVTSYNINTGKGTVTILGLSTTDSGSYICRATDGFGSTAQDSITLTAYAPLSVDITNGLTVTGTPGQSITLTCAVTGSGTITVIWIGLTGGQLLTSSKYTVGAYDTNSRQSNLTINSLTTSDAGTYTCRGSDSSGNTLVDTVQLIVTAPLSVRIINGPTVTATQGQSVTLTCEVTGSGTISVMWIGPTGFQLFTNFKYNVGAYNSNTRQSTLIINSATTSDAGTYKCRSSDSSGTQEDSTQLTFIVPLTVSIDEGDTLYRPVGNHATITCSVSGSGTISVVWIGPFGNTLTSNGKYAVTSYNINTGKGAVTILDLSTSDSGSYICRASDGFGSTAQDSITLTAYVPLTVSIDNGDTLSRPVGNDATITCSVSGSGTINVIWIGTFGNTLTSNTKYTVTSYNINTGKSTLTIFTLSTSDSGSYTCRATDGFGSTVQDSIALTAYVPLTVSIDNGDTLSRTVGSDATITCSVSGSGTISVIWIGTFGNTLTSNTKYTVTSYNINTGKSTLTIFTLSTSDSGSYACQATDGFGSTAQDSIALTAYVPLSVTIDNGNSVTGVNGGSITITCSVSGTGTITVTWVDPLRNIISSGPKYTISSYNYNTGKASLTIQSLNTNDVGNYTCRASDSSTQLEKSIYVMTAILTAVINEAVLFGSVGDNKVINCSVTGSYQSINWYLGNSLVSNGQKYQISQTTSGGSTLSSLTIFNVQYSDATLYVCQAVSSIDGVTIASDSVTLSVGARPFVTIGLTTLSGFSGQDIRVNCTVTSFESVTVTWYVNNTALTNALTSPGSRFSWQNSLVPILTISRAVVSDTGMYRCQAQNSYGTGSDTVQLTVEVNPALLPPVISVSQQSYQVDEGKSVTLNVNVNSAATVSWSRNGNLITPGQNGYNLFSANSPNLVIFNASVSHAGTYIFTASNTGGSSQSPSITLSVTAVPVVTVSPKPVTGYVGQSVTINCILTQVTSISDITILWYRNGNAISKGGTYTWLDTITPNLQILNLDAIQHPGTYRCAATSSAGTGYDQTTLNVIDKPTVSAPTTSVTGNAGSTIAVLATVTGSLITSVMWSFNGISLTNDGVNGRFSWTNQNSTGPVDLLIRNLALSDTGTYVCTVRNAAGSNELTIRLTVNAVPVVAVSPKPVTGYVGQNVTINCLITQVISISGITIAWYRNSIAISKGSTYNWSDTATPNLQISNLDATQHSGTYRCTATSSIGTGYDETTLTVIDKPTLSAPTSTITGNEGSNFTLPATVTGSLITSVMWSFNGTSLTNDGVNGRFSWTNQNSAGPVDLLIRNLALSDTGTFVCTVRNAAGSNELTIRLTVIASQPIITIPQTQYYAEEGGNMTIQCNVQGSLINGVSWTRNNAQLQNGGHYSWTVGNSPHLRIINVVKSDTGNYVCSATNSAGGTATATTPINLDVQYGPVVTIDNIATTIPAGNPVILVCRVIANPKESSVVWTKAGLVTPLTSVSTGNSTNFVFASIALTDAGTYRCQATNMLTVTGVTGSQLRQNYREITLFVQSAPTNVIIAEGSSISAQIGQTLRLTCSSDGSNPRYFWTFGSQNVSTSNYYTLNVNNRLQAGNYFCTAYNEHGSKRSNAIFVDILYAPVGISGQEVSIEAMLNVSLTLNCTVNANPPNCSYTWYDGDTQTILKGPSTSNTYFVDMNSLSDFKVYRCQADNNVGTGQVRFTVKQVTDTGTFQTGASTNDKSTLSQAAIAGIILGIIFFTLLVIIIIICCCTCGICRKDDAKTKIAPSEKKTDILHQPIVAEQKKTSEQGSDPFLANRFQSKPESATYTSPVRQRAPDSYRISRSVVSAVSRKHVDLEEKGPSYGFEDEPRYTDLPYLKTIDYPGPIISFPNGETPQAFQIPSSRSTAMYDYEEPLTQNSLLSVREDTANLYEDEDKNKKKRRKKKKRHHRHHHREVDQFGDEEPYPEGPLGTNPYLEINDYDDIEVVPGRATDTYNRYSDV